MNARIVPLVFYRVVALGCGAAVVWAVSMYPLGTAQIAIPLSAYAVLLAVFPLAWLVVVPATLPVLDLALWTGWLYLQESDLVILLTAAIGYWRLGRAPPATQLGAGRSLMVTLLAGSSLASAGLALANVDALRWSDLATYNSSWNAVRVLKGIGWAVLLLPLLRANDRDDDVHRRSLFLCGVVLGVFLAGLGIIWERNAFPGFLNFSANYRATGLFWEMHVGGAALDGYLALALPFAGAAVVTLRKPTLVALSALAFAIGMYAVLASFSRALYAACLASLVVLVFGLIRSGPGERRAHVGIYIAILIAACVVLTQLFTTGGYRTLAAAVGTIVAGFYFGGLSTGSVWTRHFALWIVITAAVTAAMLSFVPKGAYIAYCMSMVLFGLTLLAHLRGHPGLGVLAAVSWVWLGLNTLAVALHWGYEAALRDAAVAIACIGAVVLYNRSAGARLWTLSWNSARVVGVVVLVVSVSIPILAGYNVQRRFSEIGSDFKTRMDHWRGVTEIAHGGLVHQLFGSGLGQFPSLYFWLNSRGEIPGVLAYVMEDGNRFARLGGPRYAAGYGETISLFQRVPVEPEKKLVFSADMRSSTPEARIEFSLCEKWLLYYGWPCSNTVQLSPAAGTAWTPVVREIRTQDVGRYSWWGRRPAQLVLYVEPTGKIVDIDNLKLTDETGQNLLVNGDFERGTARWFFTSDQNHLPWHAKNLWLQVWFDQGWLGLSLFCAFLILVSVVSIRRMQREDPVAMAMPAAIIGFMIVGAFDSLIDNVRVAVLFFLLCMVALLKPRPAGPRVGMVRR